MNSEFGMNTGLAEKMAKETLDCLAEIQTAMQGYLRRYLVAYELPLREDVIEETFVSIIAGEAPPLEMTELVQQYIDILRSQSIVLEPFKVAMTIKVLNLTAAGMGQEGMRIVRYLKSAGIRTMELNTPIPEVHQFCHIMREACRKISELKIINEGTISTTPAFLADGRYQIREELGRGGLGIVYKALDTLLRRHVAVKRLRGDMGQSHMRAAARKLQCEAQVLAGLSHPNIVHVFDFLIENDAAYIVMECIEHPSLDHMLEDGLLKSWSQKKTMRFLLDLCQGVEYAHEKGLLHLDLKPANILVTDSDRLVPKVSDFGIAVMIAPGGDGILSPGVGTPAYMAPEQSAFPRVKITKAADVYALSKIICECFSNEIGLVADPMHESIPLVLRGVLSVGLQRDPLLRKVRVRDIKEALEIAEQKAGSE